MAARGLPVRVIAGISLAPRRIPDESVGLRAPTLRRAATTWQRRSNRLSKQLQKTVKIRPDGKRRGGHRRPASV